MQAIGYLIMAAFGLYYAFKAYSVYQYEMVVRGKAKGLLGLLGPLAQVNPVNQRLAAAFFLAIAIGINVALGYAFGVTLQGALIAEAIGVLIFVGLYFIVIRPIKRAQEKMFGEVADGLTKLFDEVGKDLKNKDAKKDPDAPVNVDPGFIQPIDCDALLGPNRPARGDENKPAPPALEVEAPVLKTDTAATDDKKDEAKDAPAPASEPADVITDVSGVIPPIDCDALDPTRQKTEEEPKPVICVFPPLPDKVEPAEGADEKKDEVKEPEAPATEPAGEITDVEGVIPVIDCDALDPTRRGQSSEGKLEPPPFVCVMPVTPIPAEGETPAEKKDEANAKDGEKKDEPKRVICVFPPLPAPDAAKPEEEEKDKPASGDQPAQQA